MSQPFRSADIRQAFIDFFISKQHTQVSSSSLIPHNDPTLLFTNAGMNQFKETFLGMEPRDYTRAVTSQKCVRAGGKHNDLDNVGYTARHHTFFEMLGNFSFGDYFKQAGIEYIWEFLTSDKWLAIDKDRLYVTIYETDDEAFEIWNKNIGIPSERIIRIGDNKGAPYASDNFWTMGDTGPCGPCTEVFYDHGADIEGGLPGTPEEDGDRYIEIWNCVFMQFNRQKDGTLLPLPAPSVDTGMGLERISAIMQGVHGNYEIDLFVHLMDAAADILEISNEQQSSLKVIADHIRAVAFLVADGVTPSNEGRGYVLRRVIRRAVRHGNKLGADSEFFYKMVAPLVAEMGSAYPELKDKQSVIENAIQKEEAQFAKTLAQGLRLLASELEGLQDGDTLSGEAAFKLYDTYGFPLDLTADITRERGIAIDEAEFDEHMQAQRERARDAGKFDVDYSSVIQVETPTTFIGYEQLEEDGVTIDALYQDGNPADSLTEGMEGVVVLDRTPFYAEGGGQVGELGEIRTASGVFEVQDTKKSGQAIIHYGVVTMGDISTKQTAEAQVLSSIRAASAKNHSATHLLHAALREVLGDAVTQKGSLVSSEVLRFDFAYDKPVSAAEIMRVERLVNEQIQANTPARIEHMSIDEAMNQGAMALFGEKYGSDVRVLTMGTDRIVDGQRKPFSIELCGGLHVQRTGDIGVLKITSESGIAAGIRRVEAVTGMNAVKNIQQSEQQLSELASQLKVKRPEVAQRVRTMADKQRDLEKQLERLQQKIASAQAANLLDDVQTIAGTPVLISTLSGIDGKSIRTLMDDIKSKLPDSVIVLIGDKDDQLALAASVAKPVTAKVKAGDIIRHLAGELGGKGGGKPDYAQGGAPKSGNSTAVISALPAWIETQLS
ncbi:MULTISPECIES: alanine--tRNA ligase [Psychrobacter]|uniref:alanine--tRNA ligase n=1 Tax=Psychrobacter TaxID=497 RepID=UPI00086ADB30|nr:MULTISPECIES: alanine--tRNA ligase [Psychrobacter]MBA6243823.1 alanine--tRNA ligase [Psychrobacter sp. Urea-trap-18]MBA6285406.1 alanine--tRNA ligase [Psychrobacter sp. Urea-trap-16]MBA6319074.1 alanine--tRNA ligase [Psychrobacter sp. Urea-trap-20]MBA6335093.1 alanine--tRNA ligase [Psychrobacter sp. Urea-trap-19]OEH69212.1 MAG: alanine--tRNA ligase [Psychrobacter sp. B29-1]